MNHFLKIHKIGDKFTKNQLNDLISPQKCTVWIKTRLFGMQLWKWWKYYDVAFSTQIDIWRFGPKGLRNLSLFINKINYNLEFFSVGLMKSISMHKWHCFLYQNWHSFLKYGRSWPSSYQMEKANIITLVHHPNLLWLSIKYVIKEASFAVSETNMLQTYK